MRPRRKVVRMVDVPYDRHPDGRPKTFEGWQLECGHTVAVGKTSSQAVRPSYNVLDVPHERTCPKCPEEDG